jgi:hypothetical protein
MSLLSNIIEDSADKIISPSIIELTSFEDKPSKVSKIRHNVTVNSFSRNIGKILIAED